MTDRSKYTPRFPQRGRSITIMPSNKSIDREPRENPEQVKKRRAMEDAKEDKRIHNDIYGYED